MVDLISLLTDTNDKTACELAKQIISASADSPEYYPCFEDFASLLEHPSSYVRTRAFALCCSQAKWDTEGKLENVLPELMALLHDPKPTVVRQCLKAIQNVIVYRPELSGKIGEELTRIDFSRYRDSMAPLIQKDVLEVWDLLP